MLDATVEPGLHWNPPLVDEVSLVNISRLNAKTYTNNAMLTTDENIIDIEVTVQYRIQDPAKYVLAVQDPERSLDNAAESAIRHVVGGNFMDQILTTGREVIAADVEERLQNYMDVYDTGIFVSQVNVVDAQPPQAVRPAFDDVIRAREDEQRAQNQAQQYSNQIIPGLDQQTEEDLLTIREGFANEEYSFAWSGASRNFGCIKFPFRGERDRKGSDAAIRGNC